MLRGLKLAALAVAAMVIGHSAFAVEANQTVDINAAPDKVWKVIADFDSIGNWHPAAASSPADHGNSLGSVRVITLKAPGDPTITEKLTAYDAAKHSYSYDITKVDPKVLPVADYHSTITVEAAGAGSKIVWHGAFKAAGGADDATAAKAITGVYRGGLDSIKAIAEK